MGLLSEQKFKVTSGEEVVEFSMMELFEMARKMDELNNSRNYSKGAVECTTTKKEE